MTRILKRRMIARSAAVAVVGMMLMGVGQSTQGVPISGTDVGLEGEPGGVVAPMPTNDAGQASFTVGPGRYAVAIWNVQSLGVPAVARIEVGRTVLTSAPILPGQGRGRAYFMGPDGRRLVAVVPGGGRIRVTLTEAASGPRPWTPVVPRPREGRS
ncbi:hypothetical protein [Brevundimonas sp.]|uniref:hypothetical protein n=1 Tax=Brevundimonas sp. TaxID=1871086 RepID=UPI0027306381|nr:hypothetical protein [Brevundimonas sp.]MDP1914249.1 hypothetical protein [Brevundimonas sp.]